MDLLLTDDEVVALAIAESGAWPTGLPTVDTGEEPALMAAALRGRRSLAVRELIGSDAPANGLLNSVRHDAVGAPSFVCLYVADQVGARASGSLNVNAYRSGDHWLVETVSEIGVHQFAALGTDELRALLEGLLQTAYVRGLAETPTESAVLWLALVTPHRSWSVSVKQETLQRHASVPGTETGTNEAASGGVAGEVERLLALATRFEEPVASVPLP